MPRSVALTPHARVGRVIAITGFACIALLTMWPQHGAPAYPPSLCIVCGERPVQDIILNVLLFVPFGLGLRLWGASRRRAVLIALVTSAAIELLQMHVIPGRDASLGDVITNTTGGLCGVLLADGWRTLVMPDPVRARRLARWGAAACALVLAGTVVAQRRTLPRNTMWGEWDPALLQFDAFPGTRLNAAIAGIPFPARTSGGDPALRRALLADSVLVTARVVPGGPTKRMASIVSLYDWRRRQIVLLGQRGRDLVFTLRMNAARAGLRTPMIVLRDAFPTRAPAGAADTLQLAGGVVDHALVLRVWDARDGRRSTQAALGPGLGWSLLMPYAIDLGPAAPWLTALWMAGLLATVAYWAAQAGSRREAVTPALALAVGLVLAPVLLGGAPSEWWTWAGGVLGSAIGWRIGGAVARRTRTMSRAARGASDSTSPSDSLALDR